VGSPTLSADDLTVSGAANGRWARWFPAIVLPTGGPVGSIAGDVILRRRLPQGA
jgi:hypothetical protein